MISELTVEAAEAARALPRLLDRAASGEQITIVRDGIPVAVLTPPGTPSSEVLRRFMEARKGARLVPGETVCDLIRDGRDDTAGMRMMRRIVARAEDR